MTISSTVPPERTRWRLSRESRPGPRTWDPRGPSWAPVLLAAPLLFVLVAGVLWPVGELVYTSLAGQGFSRYTALFESSADRHALLLTFVCSLITTAIAVLLGALLAWFVRATNSRPAKVALWLAVLVPVWMGVVVKNYAFVVILGRDGILSVLLQDIGLRSSPVDLLYTPAAVVIGMVYTMLPYAVLPLFATFVNVSLELPRAAESLGATRTRAMTSVVVPLALPAVFATGVIVFVLSLGFYLTPVILGGTSGTFVATLVQNDIFLFFDLPDAAALGTVLVLIATVVLSIGFWLIGSERLRRAIA